MFGFKKKNTINDLPQLSALQAQTETDHRLVLGATLEAADWPHHYSKHGLGFNGVSKQESDKNRKYAVRVFSRKTNPMTVAEIAKELQLSRTQVYHYLGNLVQKRPRSAK